MTFNQLDDLISRIYTEVDEAYEDRADDLVEKLADALYEDRPYMMYQILNEYDADKLFDPYFLNELRKGIGRWMDHTSKVGNYSDW